MGNGDLGLIKIVAGVWGLVLHSDHNTSWSSLGANCII